MFLSRDVTPVASQKHFCNEPKQFTAHGFLKNKWLYLFGKGKSTINEHILHIFQEGELQEELSVRKIGISDFSTKPTNFYNLDVIISVGYRVKSRQGTMFRIWATQRLKEMLEGPGKISHVSSSNS